MTAVPGQAAGRSSELDHDVIEVSDRVAKETLQRLDMVDFRLAEHEHERRASFQLRYQAVVAQGWGAPEEFPDGLEQEALDDQAVHMVGWIGAEAVASARLIYPAHDRVLPIEDLFDIRIAPVGEIVQIDRVCISPLMIRQGRKLLPGLLSAIWLEVRRQGYRWAAGLNTASVLRLYANVGVGFEILGPPRIVWSEEGYPVRFSGLCARPGS